eukprot:81127-Prymnesium_polylepis.1
MALRGDGPACRCGPAARIHIRSLPSAPRPSPHHRTCAPSCSACACLCDSSRRASASQASRPPAVA